MAKIRQGIVVSTKNNKTAIVQVDRMVPHPKYGKRYRVSKRFAVHDENNIAVVGSNVTITETRPVSKTKSWILVEAPAGQTPTAVASETSQDATPPKKTRAKKEPA